MPRYRDPATGKSIRSEEPLSDAELEEAFGQSAAPAEDEGGVMAGVGRAAGYVGGRIKDVSDAANRILPGPMLINMASRAIRGEPQPAFDPLQTGLDVMTVGGTALAPGISAIATGIGALGRGAGMSERNAQLLDAATGLVGGLSQGLYQGGRAAMARYGAPARAAAAGREADLAARESFGALAQRGAEAEAQVAGEATRAATATNAGIAARATAAAEELPVAGQALHAQVPTLRKTISAARGELFDPIIKKAEHLGLQLSDEGMETLAGHLTDAAADFGPQGTGIATAAERRVVNDLLERFTGGEAVALTMPEIDRALMTLNMKAPRAYALKRALSAAMQDMTAGTQLEGAMTNAGKVYNLTMKQGMRLATKIDKAATSGDAAKITVRHWKGMPKAAQELIDPTGEIGLMVRQADELIGATKAKPVPVPKAGPARPVRLPPLPPEPSAVPDVAGWEPLGLGVAGGLAGAAYRFNQGDVMGGMQALLGGIVGGTVGGAVARAASRHPGVLSAFVQGGAPGVGRGIGAATAVGTGAASRPSAAPPETSSASPSFLAPREASAAERPPVSASPSPQAPQQAPARATGPFGRDLKWASMKTGVPVGLLQTIMRKESRGQPGAVSPKGARGLMQLMPSTFDGLRPRIEAITGEAASMDNPRDNILAGALYLREALDKTGGKVGAAAARYHAGPNPRQHGPKTAEYAGSILRAYQASR